MLLKKKELLEEWGHGEWPGPQHSIDAIPIYMRLRWMAGTQLRTEYNNTPSSRFHDPK
jgi:hypothetical protein